MQEKMNGQRRIRRTEFLRRAKKDLGITSSAKDQRADGLADQIRKAEDRKNKKAAEEEYRGYVYGCIEKRIRRYGKY